MQVKGAIYRHVSFPYQLSTETFPLRFRYKTSQNCFDKTSFCRRIRLLRHIMQCILFDVLWPGLLLASFFFKSLSLC